jgi:hypothetical protein
MLYMVTFTINIPQMLAYIPYMDPMGNIISHLLAFYPFMFHQKFQYREIFHSIPLYPHIQPHEFLCQMVISR